MDLKPLHSCPPKIFAMKHGSSTRVWHTDTSSSTLFDPASDLNDIHSERLQQDSQVWATRQVTRNASEEWADGRPLVEPGTVEDSTHFMYSSAKSGNSRTIYPTRKSDRNFPYRLLPSDQVYRPSLGTPTAYETGALFNTARKGNEAQLQPESKVQLSVPDDISTLLFCLKMPITRPESLLESRCKICGKHCASRWTMRGREVAVKLPCCSRLIGHKCIEDFLRVRQNHSKECPWGCPLSRDNGNFIEVPAANIKNAEESSEEWEVIDKNISIDYKAVRATMDPEERKFYLSRRWRAINFLLGIVSRKSSPTTLASTKGETRLGR